MGSRSGADRAALKAHIGVDADCGVVHSLDTSTAKLHDSQIWDDLLHGEEISVWADKAYVSAAREAAINAAGGRVLLTSTIRPGRSTCTRAAPSRAAMALWGRPDCENVLGSAQFFRMRAGFGFANCRNRFSCLGWRSRKDRRWLAPVWAQPGGRGLPGLWHAAVCGPPKGDGRWFAGLCHRPGRNWQGTI